MTDEYLTDDEQLEQVKRVVAENWAWVVGGIALGAALIFGYRYYDSDDDRRPAVVKWKQWLARQTQP